MPSDPRAEGRMKTDDLLAPNAVTSSSHRLKLENLTIMSLSIKRSKFPSLLARFSSGTHCSHSASSTNQDCLRAFLESTPLHLHWAQSGRARRSLYPNAHSWNVRSSE